MESSKWGGGVLTWNTAGYWQVWPRDRSRNKSHACDQLLTEGTVGQEIFAGVYFREFSGDQRKLNLTQNYPITPFLYITEYAVALSYNGWLVAFISWKYIN